MSRLVLQRADVHGRAGGLADITIIGGRIESIVPSAGADPDPGSGSGSDSDASSTGREAIDVIDVVGRVVLPAFVEPHLHLDKAFLPFPSGDTSLADAIAHTAAQKAAFTRDGIRSRALMLVSAALANGTTRVRAQTEVDPTVGLLGVETITELADELSGVMTLQLAVFPQEGIICRPGTLDLMQIALESPGSVVGGCPYVERTPAEAREHVDLVLDLAERTGRLADLHLDFADDARDERFSLATYVAQATIDRGLHGRVAIGHVTSLGSLAAPQLAPVLELLAEARITVIVLPATDLYLGGRSDTVNQRRGLAPLASLWSAGVQVALASNNVQNAFTPTGTADLLDIALLAARVEIGRASCRERVF